MATVTKAIRWADTSSTIVGHGQETVGQGQVGGVSGGTSGSSANDAQTLVGLRMVLNPGLVRDIGTGNGKLFSLIPPGITTVRGFKNHLATNILKTHTPFYFYNGDYRIPDEEDVRIFSLLNEPCRVVPITPSKSLLSISAVSANGSIITSTSTPLPNARMDQERVVNGHGTPLTPPSAKRVKFSDNFPLDVSDVREVSNEMNADNVDHGNGFGGRGSDDQYSVNTGSSSTVENLDGISTGTKRRKRHRKHKQVKKNQDGKVIADEGAGGDVDSQVVNFDQETTSEVSEDSRQFQLHGKGQGHSKRKSSIGIQEYDADESDLSQGKQKVNGGIISSATGEGEQQNFVVTVNTTTEAISVNHPKSPRKKKSLDISEFLSPNTAFSETGGYKRIRTSMSNSSKSGSKKQSLEPKGHSSLSAFDHAYSSGDLEENDGIGSSGKRKDTPMLPKILKNPCATATYELVKKNLSFDGEAIHECSDDIQKSNDVPENQNQVKDGTGEELPSFLQKRRVQSIDNVLIGDKISFQVVELDENYTPEVSSVKVAEVVGKDGDTLELRYIVDNENQKKQRSGIYEIEEMEAEALDNPTKRNFKELIEPSIINGDE